MKNLGNECVDLIMRKARREISDFQYYDTLMELHEKYPMPGHYPSLTPRMYKNRIKSVIMGDKVKYLEDLQPYNFYEAAQMYACSVKKEVPKLDKKTLSAGENDEVPF